MPRVVARKSPRLVAAGVSGWLAVLVCAADAGAAERIYWTNSLANKISFARLDGGGGADLATTGATPPGDAYGVGVDAAAGRVYWANTGGTISFARLDGSGGGGDLKTTGATFSDPRGAAVDAAAGRVYWVNNNADKVSFARLDGTGGGDLATTGATVNMPTGVAVDAAAGRIYWSNVGGNKISFARLDGSGGGGDLNTTGATVNGPVGVAVDAAAGRIYWANSTGNKISFARLDGSGGGGDLNTTGATVNGPDGVAVDAAAGRIYWVNSTGNKISFARLDGSGGGGDLATGGATVGSPELPALVGVPVRTGAPVVSGGTAPGSVLSCSLGSWAGDVVGAQLYRAVQGFAFQWSLNGVDIAGATPSSHTASSAGEYRCRVTASNAAGSSSQTSAGHTVASPSSPADNIRPVLSSVTVSPVRWRLGSLLATFTQRRPAPVGTTISFRLSEDARVTLSFDRARPGRRVGRRCLEPTRARRNRPRCTRYLLRGSLVRSLRAGLRRVRFQGRLTRTRRLGLGRHRVRINARDGAGNRARQRVAFFTIVGR